ncbi:MAG: putative holin [Aeromonas sp.]
MMPEPSSAAVYTATASVGAAALLPWVDANALMGAVLGAALVAYSKKDLPVVHRLTALCFSAALGYLMSGEVTGLMPIQESGTGAFVGSIVIVPLATKLLSYVERFDLAALIERRGGGK